MVLAVFNFVAVSALPVTLPVTLPVNGPAKAAEVILVKPVKVLGITKEALALPLIEVPVVPAVLEMLIVRAVPQFAVVMFAEPLKDVPLIVLAVANVVAVSALPLSAPVKLEALTGAYPVKLLFTNLNVPS
jgi:hypothetical protein